MHPSTEHLLALRDAVLHRVVCPGCGGLLAADPSGDDPTEPFCPLRCLSCGSGYRWRGGVLDLAPPDRPIPERVRRYPWQGEQLDFYAFFAAVLQMGAYKGSDLEDQLYHLLGWMDPDPGKPVLQLGVGQGEMAYVLANAMPDSALVALDDDLSELAAARRNLLGYGLGNVVYVRCDLNSPPLRPGSFSSALHFGVLHGLVQPAAHLAWLGRSLTAGGRLAGLTLARSTIEQIARAQQAAATSSGLRFIPMEGLARELMKSGWASVRHEQPSNWMARFLAVRRP